MTRLYEMTGLYRDLQERAEAGEDVSEALAQLSGDIEQKGAAMVRLMRDLDLDVDKLDEEIKRLTARKKAICGNVERLKDYLRVNMEGANIQRIKAATFSICLGDGPERVEVTDEAAVPEEYVRVKREVDKAKVLAAFKSDGECVPGTTVVRGSRLTIR